MAKVRHYNNYASGLDLLQDKLIVNEREKKLLELDILTEKISDAIVLESDNVIIDYNTFVRFLEQTTKIITELRDTNF